MRKYGESKTTRIAMATVPHVTSGLGLREFQADGFLLTRVYERMWVRSGFPAMSVYPVCQSTRRHIPEDSTVHNRHPKTFTVVTGWWVQYVRSNRGISYLFLVPVISVEAVNTFYREWKIKKKNSKKFQRTLKSFRNREMFQHSHFGGCGK